jgi:dihydroxyacetone kinase
MSRTKVSHLAILVHANISAVVYQKDQDKSKVALICGGGSGHEPAHAGYVGETSLDDCCPHSSHPGKGILTAAVCGNIFASPNASQVKHALNIVDNPKGYFP